MKLRQMEIFRAVMRRQTTIGAADELVVSQPAVSNAIKQMESQIGFPLFHRHGHRLIPTAEAEILNRECEPVFLISDAVERTIHALREQKAGQVRIAATPPLGNSLIPGALKRFLQDRPDVKVSFEICGLESVIESSEVGAIDFGIALTTGAMVSRGIESELIGSSRMVCVFPPDHPLAAKDKISPSDLEGSIVIAPEVSTALGVLLRHTVRSAGHEFRSNVDVRYCHTACLMAEKGVGVAIVDGFSGFYWDRSKLAVRPFEPEIGVNAYVMYRRSRDLSGLARSVLEEIKRESSSEIARRDSNDPSTERGSQVVHLRVVGQP